jgi:hypothetical protein
MTYPFPRSSLMRPLTINLAPSINDYRLSIFRLTFRYRPQHNSEGDGRTEDSDCMQRNIPSRFSLMDIRLRVTIPYVRYIVKDCSFGNEVHISLLHTQTSTPSHQDRGIGFLL